jgi:hypothetical protein
MSEKVQKQISWFLVAKSLVKFVNDENSYKLSEKVMAATDFKKWPILKGDTCDISIEDGVVTYLRKVKKEAPKSEGHGSEEAYEPTLEEEKPKVAPTPAPAPEVKKEIITPCVYGDGKELTVFAVAANKKVVKFLEIKDDGWFTIDPSIQAKDYAVIGLQAKNKAKVQIVEKNVVSFEKVAGEAPVKATEQPKTATSSPDNAKSEPTPVKAEQTVSSPKTEYQPKTEKDAFYYIKELERKIRFLEDNKQESIEIQSAIGSAAEIVGRVAASISPAPTANVINSMLSAVARENYKLIQELKKNK